MVVMSVDVAQIGGDLEVDVVAEPVESGRRVYKYCVHGVAANDIEHLLWATMIRSRR